MKVFFCGIDVSKDKLDICFLQDKENIKPKFEVIPNTSNMIKSYFQSFQSNELIVCFESTSNYHIILQKTLSRLKIKYSVLNPAKSSLFIRHLNNIKTDLSDSYALAVYSRTFSYTLFPDTFSKEYKLLKSYSSTLLLLQKMNTQVKNFIHSQKDVNDDELKDYLKQLLNYIKSLHKKLRDINYSILKTLIPESDEILKNKGIGKDLAIVLFPVLHFNRDKNAKQIISYLGLSPRIFESGVSVKKSQSITKRGSTNIRRILFMNSLSCIHFNDYFKEKYNRLIANGKHKKVAIVAVMCAIIRYLKTYFKEDNYQCIKSA